MMFSTSVESLKNITTLMTRVSGKDNTTDLGDKILLTVDSAISLRAINLESGVECGISGTIEREGEVLLTGSVFAGVVAGLVSTNVSITLKENNVVISSDTSVSSIRSLSYDGFPAIPAIKQTPISLEVQSLMSGFRMVVHASSQSVVHPEYTGVCVIIEKKTLYLVATDGHRLAEARFSTDYENDFSVIIPLTGVSVFNRFLEMVSKQNTIINFVVDESGVHLYNQTSHIYSRVINSQFPAYREIIPQTTDTQVIVLKSDLFSFFRKAHLFSSNKHNTVDFAIEKNTLSLTASNEDVGETKDSIPAEVNGNPLQCMFNYRYINDVLSHIDDDRILLEFSQESSKPLIISGADTKIFKSLIMPSFTQGQ